MKRLFVPVLALLVAGAFSASAQAESNKPVCPGPAHNGAARCHAHVITDAKGKPLARPQPQQAALTPVDLQSAYGLTTASAARGSGSTIAIVDAYHYPTAEADLATYRSAYGLGPCTTGNGCFQQVDQTGGTNYPAVDAGWAQEEALDIDMASAICPNCKIILVEANSAYMTDLGAAVNQAAAMHADVISNSYGGSEYGSETLDENAYYKHPGTAITVSSGDSGYGAEFPAASRYVTAVGGTSLRRTSGGRGWTETAWSGAGSGCSRYVSKPSWQDDSGCAKRTIADVSAVADPATGVSVYDSTPYGGASGWLKFGGTSVAAPLVGGVYALSASPASDPASLAYQAAPGSLFDVTSGSNARRCSPAYLCTSGSGYDGPTGLGTPNGLGAF